MKRSAHTKSAFVAAGFAGVLLALSLGHSPAFAQSDETASKASPPAPLRRKPDFPKLSLPDRQAQGQRAIDLLAGRLPEVAAWYGKSPEEFRAQLQQDRRLKIDRVGRVFVEEEIVEAQLSEPSKGQALSPSSFEATTAATAASVAVSGAVLPLDQTFVLHSRPGSSRTIYLNFKGAQLKNTVWNGSSPTLTALPYDLDGIPYTFSTTELERIQYIWQRVAEDFAPFDVNVTTEAPASEALTRSSMSDGAFGISVLITKRSGVYSCSCGGVAYIGIFDDTIEYFKPALVFYDGLGAGSEKGVAEAISHEVGHTMGLLHDGSATTAYYTGHGSGATGWAPIMGVGYNKPLVQWSKGEYATANNLQDDLTVMGLNGLPLRADDYGNTMATASPLPITVSGPIKTLEARGVIERPSDVDVFSFSSGAGNVTFNLATAARSTNLDAKVELRNSAGTLIASANPVDFMSATLTWTVPAAGTYYVSVQGVGKGDPLTTGYSDYGSLGQYRLTGTLPSTANQVPVAVVAATPNSGTVPLATTFNGASSYDPDGAIVSYEWNFGDGSPPLSGVSARHSYSVAGAYTATLKVTDNGGMTTLKSIAVTALATAPSPTPANKVPVAAVAATPNSGTVPLATTFSGAGSYDPDGAIVAYEWNFGDGSPPVSGVSARHSYNVAGSYTATLKVTDNGGMTTLKSIAVSALAPVAVKKVAVADIAMRLMWVSNSKARAGADIKVVDAANKPVQGAVVTTSWTGLATGIVSGVTGSTGIVTLWSPVASTSGTYRLGVTAVTLPGSTYDASLNVESADAISR